MNMFDLGGMLLRVGRAITPPDTRLVHSDARGKQQWRVGDFYKQSAQEPGSNRRGAFCSAKLGCCCCSSSHCSDPGELKTFLLS